MFSEILSLYLLFWLKLLCINNCLFKSALIFRPNPKTLIIYNPMIDGSAGSSLHSLREISSDNSEFELVDIVGTPLSKPSSVGVLRSPTSPRLPNPVPLTSKHDHQSSVLKAVNEQPEICEYEQGTANPMNILLENKRLRMELAEAKAQLVVLSKEIESYRQKLGEGGRKAVEIDFDAAVELNVPTIEPQQSQNGRKASSMGATFGSLPHESKLIVSNSQDDAEEPSEKATAEPKNGRKTVAQTFPRTHCKEKPTSGVRSASSPPLPKLSPPRSMADAQLLDLLGAVQPVRDANRPAAPPPKKNSWCKVCGQWLCNSYFLRAHMQSQHAMHGKDNGREKKGHGSGKEQNATDNEQQEKALAEINLTQYSTQMTKNVFFDANPSHRLININEETSSPFKMTVNPKPIRPVPKGQFRIKWEEEDEETEEEDEEEGTHLGDTERDRFSWSLIGQVSNGRPMTHRAPNGKADPKKNLTDELTKRNDNEQQTGGTQRRQQQPQQEQRHNVLSSQIDSFYSADSASSPSTSPSLSSDRHQQKLYSSSSSADSAFTSSTASSTMHSTNNTSEDEERHSNGQPMKETLQDQNGKPDSLLNDSILNRLLYIAPPVSNKQKPLIENNASKSSPNNSCRGDDVLANPANHGASNPKRKIGQNRIAGMVPGSRPGEFDSFDNEFCKLREEFHVLSALYEQKDHQRNEQFDSLENRMSELNIHLEKFYILTKRVREEQKTLREELKLDNRCLCEDFVKRRKEMKTLQSQVDLLEQCLLRQFVATLQPVHEDGSLVLSQFEKGNYCAEMKMLFQSGSRFCPGLAIKGSAHFRNYPSHLFDQLIEHAVTTRKVPKMVRWAVLNFPASEKCPWPQVLLVSDSCASDNSDTTDKGNNNKLYIYRNWIRKRAVLPDRVVYCLLNQHSPHKFVVNIYYSSAPELFKQMHCFTIRRQRPSH